MANGFPFILTGDHETMIKINSDGSKHPLCFAQMACQMARKFGITEVSLTDHDVKPMQTSESRLLLIVSSKKTEAAAKVVNFFP